ncbi:AAA family ATPase [Candidatus Neptunochlamydia vexilliferae]|uniref:AAA family ATPase n=1 Tax=Candidatus Neptunichlamydia vexilliferae TaxID=1651774 RepID=UPI001890D2F4|nr:AAA family ATPase [Candidatus Neptunochlamydia vexilliferae]
MNSNPFKFGNPVEGDYYLARPELHAAVKQFLQNRIHVVLMGPRRFGKTSFVLSLLRDFEKEGYTCLLVDIFNITSHRDFLRQLLRAIRLKEGLKGKLRGWLKKLATCVPKVTADLDTFSGSSSFGLTLGKLGEEDVKEAIQDLLEVLSSLGKKVVVAVDEFQKVSEIDDQGWLEATLRTHLQRLKNVSFLLTGSRKDLILEMLNNPSRPLYRSCQTIEFPAFGPEFVDWIVGRFKTIGTSCKSEAIKHLLKLVQNIPNYAQKVCFHLVAQGCACVTGKEVEEVLENVVRQNAYTYQTLISSLTLAQKRALRLAAYEKGALFNKEVLQKYEITSAPALSSSIKALKAKGILDEEGGRGKVLFDDPLFAYWLRLCFSP